MASAHHDEFSDELTEELDEAERLLAAADEADETPPNDIVAFNELRSCSDLNRLHEHGQLTVQPDYQRDVVWKAAEQTRFVDSLAKQLPIPSMCISLDYKTDNREVVDGLQRMSSIIRFLSDPKWRLSKLDDIDKRISGKTVDHIRREYPELQSRIENTTIPITVLRCDLSKRSHQEYLFTIFHRLNTGGQKLTNQEIRNCIYSGEYNDMLKEVVNTQLFKDVFSIEENRKYRFSNEELVLRVLAFAQEHENYRGPLSKFLNKHMAQYRAASGEVISSEKAKFERALAEIYRKALAEEPLPRLSKATTEALFVGVICNIDRVSSSSQETIKSLYSQLRKDDLFSVESLKEGLAATDKVKARLTRAIEIFSDA